MADFLHYEFETGPEHYVEVTLDHAANVQLLDPLNYQNYRAGRQYSYLGGYVTKSPFLLRPPQRGRWHVVIDLGGGAGRLRTSARLIPV